MKKPGFTLIELLVVISIIGILAALLIANMVGIRERARDSAIKTNLGQLQTALRLYYNDLQRFPPHTISTCSQLITELQKGNYIQPITIDVPNGGSCTYENINGSFTWFDTDGYIIGTTLYSGAGNDDTNSGKKCGKGEIEKRYFVCAM